MANRMPKKLYQRTSGTNRENKTGTDRKKMGVGPGCFENGH